MPPSWKTAKPALATLAALAACVAPAAAATPPGGTAATLLRALNRARAQAHLAALRIDPRMSDTAGAYSREMARTRRIDHGSWTSRVARSAGTPDGSGEVIGWLTPGTAQAEASWVVNAWLNSPVHRRVLLDGSFRRIGIGRAASALTGSPTAIYTVDFATPR